LIFNEASALLRWLRFYICLIGADAQAHGVRPHSLVFTQTTEYECNQAVYGLIASHDALECLRAGMDIFALQKLMGHADLQILKRYLKQSTDDTSEVHRRAGPVDNANLE